jgi:SAM-dependent methyltransferase
MYNDSLKYFHDESVHNSSSPEIIVPYLMDIFKPNSVLDIGCGLGTFLYEFKKHKVDNIVGVDGNWVDKKKLVISSNNFIEADLEKPINLNKKFDIVLCLEVAEHLVESAANTIVDSLCKHGNIIIFSAAIKNQIGQNHINEQPFSYWHKKFKVKGYEIVDLFRPVFWNDTKVQWWYKQNMFLLVHESVNKNEILAKAISFNENFEAVHPELYESRIKKFIKTKTRLDNILAGNGGSIWFYIKLLGKKMLNFFKNSK